MCLFLFLSISHCLFPVEFIIFFVNCPNHPLPDAKEFHQDGTGETVVANVPEIHPTSLQSQGNRYSLKV